jgi:serine phosphatase RsbU (regulator of sigma subunit)/anti-sigma regulatory factor (Ser/Thr protein kinase)
VAYFEPTSSTRELAELQRFTDAALAHLAMDELLAELLERITEILQTDTAAILLLDEAGEAVRATAAKGIEEEVEQGVRIPVGKGFAGRIAAEHRPIFIADVDRADIYNPILREKGIRSLLGVPLLVESRVLGVLHVGTLSPREFTDADAELLQVAADRAALAIDHAALFERERRAREEADRAVGVLRAVQRITDAALAGLSLEDLLRVLLDRVAEILRTDTVAILLLDNEGRVLRARAAKGIEEEVEQGVRIPVGKGFAGRIAAEHRPIFIPDVDRADIYNPILREKGIRSLLGVPLLVEGRVIGVLHVGTLTAREFTDGDAELLQVAADRAALAIDHAQGFEERRLAAALQAALLPQEMIGTPGVEVAARYLPAAQGGSLGGDWYDVFPLGGGRLGLAVGDVVGRGLAAAALMAQLRTALRAYAFEGHPPEQVVERVNDLLCFIGPSTMVTAAYLVLDPERETLQVVNAGHPPALLVEPDDTARYLDLPHGVPLGVSRGSLYQVTEHRLPTGATVVLYTDGVVEVRGESIDVGLERLRGLAAAGHDSIEALCESVVGELVSGGRAADDVALLAARIVPLEDELTTEWPAHADSLAGLRHLLRRWLRGHGANEQEVYDITVACQEAAANAVEHAYAPGARSFEVDAVRRGPAIEVTIRDHGQWRPARGTHRGRGLPLMTALMDSVEIDHGEAGSVVVLRRKLAAASA